MSTLTEIQAATASLPPEQQEELYRFLGARLHPEISETRRARLVRRDDDLLLEAPLNAPAMTAENVKKMLEDWP